MSDLDQPDSESVEEHFRLHREPLFRYLTGLLGDPHLASDTLQATFTKLLQNWDTLEKENIRAWLFRVGFNQAMESRRKFDVDRRAMQKIAAGQSGFSDERSAIDADQIELIRAAIRELPETHQQVVQMRIYHDKKFAEIAEELDVPLGTVLTRMRTALKKLSVSIKRQDH